MYTMALKTFVKLNSITNLTDARYGAGMYVNLLGFDLSGNTSNSITPDTFREITGWVSGVDFVGEFTHGSGLDLLDVLKAYPSITWIEYDYFEGLRALIGSDYSLIYKVRLDDLADLEQEIVALLNEFEIVVHVVSEDSDLSESGLAAVKYLAKHTKVLLGTGVTAENILGLVDDAGIFGISLTGGEEIKPGLKDLNELADILEKLETEE